MDVRRFADLDFRELPGRWSADPLAGMNSEDTSVRVVRLHPGLPRSPHRHPRSCEVVYVVEGEGQAWQEGQTRTVTEGDTVLIPRGVPHATLPDRETSLLLVCFFPDSDLAANLEELPGTIHQR